MPKSTDALVQWLELKWDRPERSYNPEVREFFAVLLGYPKQRVVTEDKASIGYPDIKLLTSEGTAWVVGDLKKDDMQLLDSNRRQALWNDKRKYVDGLTRYVMFLTAHFFWIVTPEGNSIPGFEAPLDLRSMTQSELQSRLHFICYDLATHQLQWQEFVEGRFPYIYLRLDIPETLRQLRSDLRASFQELTDSATRAIEKIEANYNEYRRRRQEIEQNLVGRMDTQRRAIVRLELEYSFERHLFEEAFRQFEEQYGRDIERTGQELTKRIQEAFIADSAAALIARVLFLRLVEDLHLQPRRLSNGGPKNWAIFVHNLTGDARALVRLVSEDMEQVYREPFAPTVFDWIQRANGELDISLQRLILRLNAYDFAGLSEEILGDIYQQFLPPQKRKKLGEYYTPSSIVEWLLDQTVRMHGLGTLLDPACGSGSFLVRYAHWRLEDARQRGLDIAQVSRELQSEVWGFDLNPFAAFISLFQLMWALLRFEPTAPSPHIQVYNLNSLLRDTDIVAYIGEEHLPPGSKARDAQKWKYVLGNPPYIRAERVKYGTEMRELWAHVWGKNADTGLLFLYRSLTEWLEPRGLLGMVVSGGYANSETAGKVWQLLHPGQTASLRKIVWLEFIEADGRPTTVWDVARVPMLLIIEKMKPDDNDEIELAVPTQWPSNEPTTKVRYADFFDQHINPRVTNHVAAWGDYLLPLLNQSDIQLLRKLSPNGNGSNASSFEPLGNRVKWTYGIQNSGVEVTEVTQGAKSTQVTSAKRLAIAWSGEPEGWLDLDAVAQKPYGKLSLWRKNRAADVATVFVAQIARCPFASVGGDFAALNSIVVAEVTSLSLAKAIAAYLNSKLARFYWALKLRNGVLQGYYAQIYPRTLDAMPWPKILVEQPLVDSYDRLAELAVQAKNNPNEWILMATQQRLAEGHLRITEPSLGLRIVDSGEETLIEGLHLEGCRITPLVEFARADLAEYVFLLLTLNIEEQTIVSAQDIQKLIPIIPTDYGALLMEYRQRMSTFKDVEQNFMLALEAVDDAVFTAFALQPEERETISQRLNHFPLNRLQPRYPWQSVRPRPIKVYKEPRFT